MICTFFYSTIRFLFSAYRNCFFVLLNTIFATIKIEDKQTGSLTSTVSFTNVIYKTWKTTTERCLYVAIHMIRKDDFLLTEEYQRNSENVLLHY